MFQVSVEVALGTSRTSVSALSCWMLTAVSPPSTPMTTVSKALVSPGGAVTAATAPGWSKAGSEKKDWFSMAGASKAVTR